MDEGLFVGLIGKGILLITKASATNFHFLSFYFQVMLWMGTADGMEVTEWGWNYQYNSLIPVMLDSNPAPEALLKMTHSKCSTGCSSLRYSYIKQRLNCGNMKEGIVPDDETEDEIENVNISIHLRIYPSMPTKFSILIFHRS